MEKIGIAICDDQDAVHNEVEKLIREYGGI